MTKSTSPQGKDVREEFVEGAIQTEGKEVMR